jgi:hypothetical protein
MTYTTDLGSFPTLIRAFNDSLMTLYLTEDDILREVVIYEGIIGAGRISAAAPQNFAVHSGSVLFRHLTWTQYHQIMATFLVMIGPVTVFANNEVVPGEYNEELTEEQVDDTFERGQITMFSGGGHQGNLGGRSGADLICGKRATKEFEHIRAFLSVNSADEIRDMPDNYGVPTDWPIVGPTGVKIADDWGDLLDGSIDMALSGAEIVTDDVSDWWSGSNADGSVHTNTCQEWTTNSSAVRGRSGSHWSATASWISSTDQRCDYHEDDNFMTCIGWN